MYLSFQAAKYYAVFLATWPCGTVCPPVDLSQSKLSCDFFLNSLFRQSNSIKILHMKSLKEVFLILN